MPGVDALDLTSTTVSSLSAVSLPQAITEKTANNIRKVNGIERSGFFMLFFFIQYYLLVYARVNRFPNFINSIYLMH